MLSIHVILTPNTVREGRTLRTDISCSPSFRAPYLSVLAIFPYSSNRFDSAGVRNFEHVSIPLSAN